VTTRAPGASVTAPPVGERWAAATQWLDPYRPRLRDRRFWVIQVLVAMIAAVHFVLESEQVFELSPDHIHSLFLVPISLFFVPVVYAALTFGLPGGLATAAWATILAAPNLLLFHDPPEQLGELVQIAMVDAVAVLAGVRVDRELRARRHAEATSAALQASEAKYRGLFESSPSAILVLDQGGGVIDANPAAGVLFERTPETLRGRTISEVIDPQWSQRLLDGSQNGVREIVTLRTHSDRELHLEPAVTRVAERAGRPLLQVIFRDATEERLRHAGLRAFAAHVLGAQEAERKRIAQELHDETVQKIVLVCRQLDVAETSKLPAASREALSHARRTAEEIVEELRDFARALRPPALEDLGLVSALRRLLAEIAERERVEVSFDGPLEERRLAPESELALFRIAQEALRNVEHHAQASHVRITITVDLSEVRLEVADDGIGFTAHPGQDFAAAGHLGLLGMRERAETLGGSLDVRSGPQGGTRISATIPLGLRGRRIEYSHPLAEDAIDHVDMPAADSG